MATSIITGLNANIRPCIINFREWSLLLDGNNIPRILDQNQGYIWKHYTPTTAITANESAAGSMSGVYKYVYTEYFKSTGDGDLYSGMETLPSAVYTTGTLSSKKVTLTLPGSAVNTGASHLKVYRTNAAGTIYYYINNVAIGTTSLEDNNTTGDTNNPYGKLTTGTDGTVTQDMAWNTPVSNHKYCVATKTRVITAGVRPYNTGTVTMAASTSVTGSGTSWTKALEGCTLYVSNLSRGYTISTVSSTTALTLSEAYAGATGAGKSYEIVLDHGIVRWSAKNPLTAKPQWFAFPTTHYRYIRRGDDSTIMGLGIIGDQAVVFKQRSHYLLTESSDDFIDAESSTRVGTCSHWSIVTDPDDGSLVFLSYDGKLFKTSGLLAQDLNIDLTLTVDGINMTYAERCQAVWYPLKQQYIMIYPSEDYTGDGCDRILVWDKSSGQWVIWKIYANCIALIESSETTQTVKKPWIGTIGGFVYKLCTGNNLGVASGTVTGTSTAIGTATVTDSTATFYTTGDGLKDVYVQLYDTTGTYKEEQKVLSNTGTIITVDTNWTSSPVAGWTYEVGGIRSSWKSKVFDYGSDFSKTVRNFLLNFRKLAVTQYVTISFYFSETPFIASNATASQTLTFDLLQDYFDKLSLYDNRSRYVQFEVSWHTPSNQVTIYNATLDAITINR